MSQSTWDSDIQSSLETAGILRNSNTKEERDLQGIYRTKEKTTGPTWEIGTSLHTLSNKK